MPVGPVTCVLRIPAVWSVCGGKWKMSLVHRLGLCCPAFEEQGSMRDICHFKTPMDAARRGQDGAEGFRFCLF